MPLKRLNLNTRALERVSIVNTELETLDLSFSERLWDINLASNKLTDIRVDETPSLEFLGLNNNPLSAETIEYLYTLPNTVAVDVLAQHTIDGIYFEDPGLAQCIREEKRFNNHSVFDMQGLNCTRAGIHSLAGVENMLELRTVRLGQNELISLEPLESLANLGLVEAWGNDLKSVDFSRLSNLKSIYLSKNPNLFELKLPQSDLLVLDLSGVGISELDVSAYENLHSLHLGSNSIIKDFVSGYHPKLKDLDFSSDLADGMKLPVFANLESLSTDARLISAQYLAQLKGLKNLFLMNAEEILDDLDLSKNQVLESVRLSGDLSGTLQIENSPNLLYVSLPEEHDLQVIKRVYELQGRMFSDADFFSCIDDHLKALGGSALLSEIKTLDCDGYDIVSLNGIAALSELQSLSLLNTHVSKVDLFYSDNLTEFSISSPILSGIAISGDLLEVFYHCCPVNFHSNFS